MAGKRGELVPRPPRKVEYEIRFGTASAQKGWQDLLATTRNQMVDVWDFLTRTPDETTPTNYRLKGELGSMQRGGVTHQRWQHKPTERGTARIWFYIEGHVVHLEQVHTSHPHETK